jgi:branched-chain amino acid transport system permease protein
MSVSLAVTQLLNGLQLGMLLFVLSAGLTLVFGIMNVINLAHGALFMLGAYFAVSMFAWSGSFLLAVLAAGVGTMVVGIATERVALARLYDRDHLDQVLCTFGLILIFNEIVRGIWGPAPVRMGTPEYLSGAVPLLGFNYPEYRLAVIVIGLVLAGALFLVIHRTRAGMLIRAAATNGAMLAALGVDSRLVYVAVFAFGALLAGLAGAIAGPMVAVQPGMGEPILILAFVVIVTGGVGSVRGAFLGAMVIGVVDAFGRAFLPLFLREMFDRNVAQAAGPAIASMLIYLLMAVVLAVRPEGLFRTRGS